MNEGFIYSDQIVDGHDSFRHSKWISFMSNRLIVAKTLLSDKGLIFISVDENEYAQLKLLCDDIFNENCFVENIVWNKRVPKNDKGIGNIHEYILIYTSNPQYKYKLMSPKEGIAEITSLINIGIQKEKTTSEIEKDLRQLYKKEKYPRAITLYNNLDNNYRIFGKINMSWPNGNTFGSRYDVLHPITGQPVKVPDRGWRWSQKTFMENVDYENPQYLQDGSIICGRIWFSGRDNMQPSSVNYLDEVDRMLLRSIISLKSDGGMVLENIFKKKSIFAYPKPVTLIKMLVDACTYENRNATILDFFAGSGTTGHAVMQLNKEDGGNRKYILCTNNENNICKEVTYQRLKNIQEELPHNLKYYNTEFIPKFSNDEESISEKMMEHIRELIELEYAIELDGEKYIVLNDEDELDESISKIENDGKLFVRSGIFLSRSNQRILEEKGVSIIEIPEYYFREELKEVGEL